MKKKIILCVTVVLVVAIAAAGCSASAISGKWLAADGRQYEFTRTADYTVTSGGVIVEDGVYSISDGAVYLYAPDHDHTYETDVIYTLDGDTLTDNNGGQLSKIK